MGEPVSRGEALAILGSTDDELLAVLDAAFTIRRHACGRRVRLHVLRNARSGICGEDCAYCSQSVDAGHSVPRYPLQSVEELLDGARHASHLKATRYCVAASGRTPSTLDIERICNAVRRIKGKSRLQVCVSLGLLSREQARQLKEAGVDRYNHNLETSERFFPEICTTHAYQDRWATATAVKAAGLELCCGALLGMGETAQDRVDVAFALKDVGADSIPVNFLDPRPGTRLAGRPRMKAADALRALALFRFVHPGVEIRVAGGREACLGPLQPLALFVADSLFTAGYLTTGGQGYSADKAMIEAAGFHVDAPASVEGDLD